MNAKFRVATTYGQVCKSSAEVVAVFCVETSVVYKIDTAANDIAGGERRPVGLPSPGRTERVSVISVIPVRLSVPAWQPVQVDALGGESDTHISISTFAHYFHFEVIETARCGDWMYGLDTGGIFVGLPVPYDKNHDDYTQSD